MLGGERSENERVLGTRSKIILNVGGLRHETYVGTLRNIPDSRLYSLTNNNPTQVPEFDPNSGEFFFDRHPLVFAQILNYYRTGKLHCPNDVCGPIFEEELAFWGLEDASIETCCWMNYKKHGEAQANLSSFDKMVEEGASEHEYNFHDEGDVGLQTRSYKQVLRKYKSRIWLTMEEPSSSLTAKIIAMLSMLLIIASVITSCLETMEYFSKSQSTQHQVIHIVEIICVIWFTAEIIIRFAVCPSKRKFIKQIMNWLDFAAIIPFYLQLFLTNTEMNSILALRIIRLIRVFRVFKLSRHSYSLQILGHTLRSSLSELFLLGFFLSIGVVVFSTLMFYAEHESKANKFSSIPAGFWWAVVTMTTLGYGDIVPETLPGKLVGTACAICGVLTIALPIPVIVSNFSLYYSHAKAKQKASQRKRPLVIGAANALKVIDPFVGSRATNLRLSAMSENVSYMSPSSRVSNWPNIALDMAGSSFDSSEPPASPSRKRFQKLPDMFWQFDQTKNLDNNNTKRCISPKNTDDTSAHESSENNRRGSKDFTIIVPKQSHGTSTTSSEIEKRQSITSSTQDEPWQDLKECFDPSQTKKCTGAYENEAIEQNSENENTPRNPPMFQFEDEELESDQNHSTLPKIEIICNSSTSQMSGSNNEDETSDQKSSKKTKKKLKRSRLSVEKAASSPAFGDQSFSGKNLPGRMGRRGSVFVVGFIGKKWQAKAAKNRKNRRKSKPTNGELSPNKSHSELLQVSPTISSRGSTANDESCRTSMTSSNTPHSSVSSTQMTFRFPGNQASPEPSSFRRSSCPTLPTLNIFEDKHIPVTNGCIEHNKDEISPECCDTNDMDHGSRSLDKTRSNTISSEGRLDTNEYEFDTKNADVHTNHIRVDSKYNRGDTNHCEVNTKHDEFKTKGTKLQTKHDVDFMRNKVETNRDKVDMKQYEEENGSPGMDDEVNICNKKDIVDLNCSELNNKLSQEETIFDYKGNKNDGILKRLKLSSQQGSLSSNESDSSLKAKFDRSSSPLMRQQAFFSCEEKEDKDLDNNDKKQGLQTFFTVDHDSGQTIDYHGQSGKASKTETGGPDSTKSKRSTITLVEIGKNRPPNSNYSSTDSLPFLQMENTKQGESINIPCNDEYNLTKGSPIKNKHVVDAETAFMPKQDTPVKKITSETIHNKPKTKSVANNQVIIINKDNRKDLKGKATELVNKTGKPSNPHFEKKEMESNKSFQETKNESNNENISGKNKEVYVKSLMSEKGGLKKKNFRSSTANQEQELINGHRKETKHNCREKTNGISHQETADDLHFDDKCDINKTNKIISCTTNYTENDRTNKDEPIQNNNWNLTNGRKYETVDTPENKNSTISSVDVKEHSTSNLSKTNQSTANENRRRNTAAPKCYSRNLAYRGDKYRSLTSSQGSADRSKSFEYTGKSGAQHKVEAQDSGISCNDYRSSIDSVTSFTERNSEKEMLKTISEVEHNYDYRDGMLYFRSLSEQYYEKSRSFVLEIRDETAV